MRVNKKLKKNWSKIFQNAKIWVTNAYFPTKHSLITVFGSRYKLNYPCGVF